MCLPGPCAGPMMPDRGAAAVPSAVVVFTFAYPYGIGEEFLDGELPHLLAEFDRVIVVPTLQLRGQLPTRQVPDGVDVVAPESPTSHSSVCATPLGQRSSPGGPPAARPVSLHCAMTCRWT